MFHLGFKPKDYLVPRQRSVIHNLPWLTYGSLQPVKNCSFSSLGESTMLWIIGFHMLFLFLCHWPWSSWKDAQRYISEFTLNLRVAIWNFLLPSQKWRTSTSTDGTIYLKSMTGVVLSVLFLHPWAQDMISAINSTRSDNAVELEKHREASWLKWMLCFWATKLIGMCNMYDQWWSVEKLGG